MSDFKEVIQEALKLITRARYAFWAWVVCLALLLLSQINLPELWSVSDFVKEFAKWIRVVGLAAFILWLVETGCFLWGKGLEWLTAHWEKQEAQEQKEKTQKESQEKAEAKRTEMTLHLETLNPHEAETLFHAINKKAQTFNKSVDDPAVCSLISKGLLEPVPQLVPSVIRPFTVPRSVWDEINKPDVAERLDALGKQIRVQWQR